MANVIVYKNANVLMMSPGQVVTLGENSSFDTVTERLYFGSGLGVGYDAGGSAKPIPPVAGTWVCIGPSDVESLPGGAVIATITWRGLKDANQVSVTDTCSVKETSYEALANVPAAPGATPVKANVYDVAYGASIRSIHTTSQSAPSLGSVGGSGKTTLTQVGGVNLGNPPTQNTISGMPPVYNHPWGWIPFSWQQEEPVKGIFFVSAEYRYIPQMQFG